ncbi:hypothetical protein CSUI_001986, partial [Cystoisospora suis]
FHFSLSLSLLVSFFLLSFFPSFSLLSVFVSSCIFLSSFFLSLDFGEWPWHVCASCLRGATKRSDLLSVEEELLRHLHREHLSREIPVSLCSSSLSISRSPSRSVAFLSRLIFESGVLWSSLLEGFSSLFFFFPREDQTSFLSFF